MTGRILLILLWGALTACSQPRVAAQNATRSLPSIAPESRPSASPAQRPVPQSLSSRLESMTRRAADSQALLWRTAVVERVVIGGDGINGTAAIHSPDYGVLWSIAALTDQPDIRDRLLPSARNFKLKQMDIAPGFFQGAPFGDYFLPAEKRFASARDTEVAPADLAGALQDLGNVLLYNPNDAELRERLRLGAERLLAWQHSDGQWDPAYDRASQKATPTRASDPRPVFYGLHVAHRILGDSKYLAAARRGADWFISHPATNDPSGFLSPAYVAQALLDLPAPANGAAYRDAAIHAARSYLATIDATGRTGPVNGSPAGLLLRVHELTGNTVYRDTARAGILGENAFTDSSPNSTSWSQIGGIMDYLISEAHLRSGGKIEFPRGFITPKAGPHQPYGFAPGKIFGESAFLKMPRGLITSESPQLEYLSALAVRDNRLFVIALNNSDREMTAKMKLDPARLLPGKTVRWMQGRPLAGGATPLDPYGNWQVKLEPYGLAVIQLTFQ